MRWKNRLKIDCDCIDKKFPFRDYLTKRAINEKIVILFNLLPHGHIELMSPTKMLIHLINGRKVVILFYWHFNGNLTSKFRLWLLCTKSIIQKYCCKSCFLLVILSPAVNFTSIFWAAFLPIFFYKKFHSLTISRENFCKTNLYEKTTCKMYMKFIPVWLNMFTNICAQVFCAIKMRNFFWQTVLDKWHTDVANSTHIWQIFNRV